MSSSISETTYSALVRLQLIIGDETLELAQIGPHGVVLCEPRNLAPGAAEVVMHVDDNVRSWRVKIPNGATDSSPVISIIRCGN